MIKKWLCLSVILGFLGFTVSASAFTPGRDIQPVSGTVAVNVLSIPSVTGTVTANPSDVTIVDSATMIQDYTLADTGTTYIVTIPAKCVGYEFQLSESQAMKWSNVSGGIAAHFWTLKSGTAYNTPQMGNSTLYTGLLYFNCSAAANTTLEIIFWLKP